METSARALVLVGFVTGAALLGNAALCQAQITGALGTRGATATSRALNDLRSSVMRPLPVVPPAPVYQPSQRWVPDQFERIPGAPDDVHVPAHWELRQPDGTFYSPPLIGATPEGQHFALPGHVAP